MHWEKLRLQCSWELRPQPRIAGNERAMVGRLAQAYLVEDAFRCHGAAGATAAHERRAMVAMLAAAVGDADRRWWLDEAAARLARRWARSGRYVLRACP